MKSIVLMLFILISSIAFSQSENTNKKSKSLSNNTKQNFVTNSTCEELVNYRDKILAKEFNSAYLKYTLNIEAKEDIRKIKESLLSDKASWYSILSTNSTSSDMTLAYAEIVQVFKLLSDKYSYILKLLSGNTLYASGVDYGTKSQDYWYNVIKSGKTLHKAVMENAEKEAYKEVMSKAGAFGNSIKAGVEFVENINEFSKLEKDHTELKKEITRQLDLIDKKYNEYERSIKSSEQMQNQIIEVVKGIDKYLIENKCDSNDAIETMLKKELEKAPNLIENVSNPNFIDSAYMFIAATINVKGKDRWGKRLYLFSAPILYKGDIYDSKEKAIEEFFSKAEKTIPDIRTKYSGMLIVSEKRNIDNSYEKFLNIQDCLSYMIEYKKGCMKGWSSPDSFEIIDIK
ncbi:hypothetical protein ACM55F_07730 [Flavobacterium sp. XS2P12]|uniref:hypothetical protein n=1 Tax=Flavobacterium melibiosi TaxID=3398734 RepID=UPI003A85D853